MKSVINKLRQIFAAPDSEVYPDVIDDTYAVPMAEREEIALQRFSADVNELSLDHKISRRKAFCKLMAMDGVNCRERAEVEKFFWREGISEEHVQALTDEFYRLQKLKFNGDAQ